MTEDAVFELLSLECRVDAYGTVRYYNALGELHRAHGPAVIYEDGAHVWYQNGQRHRVDGPAIENADGYRAWFINGERLSLAEWQQVVASMESV